MKRDTIHGNWHGRAICGHRLDRAAGHRLPLWHERITCPTCRRMVAALRARTRAGLAVPSF